MTTFTIAQQIAQSCKHSNDAISLAENNSELTKKDQNWKKETTTFYFSDKSKLVIHNDEIEVK